MATEAMCMCDTWSSMWRKEASRGLRRSGFIDPPFGGVPAPDVTPGCAPAPRVQPAVTAQGPPEGGEQRGLAIRILVSS